MPELRSSRYDSLYSDSPSPGDRASSESPPQDDDRPLDDMPFDGGNDFSPCDGTKSEPEFSDESDQEHVPHVLAPTSGGQAPLAAHARACLLWACKACKRKNVTVDRRKAATMRERRRLRRVSSFVTNAIKQLFVLQYFILSSIFTNKRWQ